MTPLPPTTPRSRDNSMVFTPLPPASPRSMEDTHTCYESPDVSHMDLSTNLNSPAAFKTPSREVKTLYGPRDEFTPNANLEDETEDSVNRSGITALLSKRDTDEETSTRIYEKKTPRPQTDDERESECRSKNPYTTIPHLPDITPIDINDPD